MYAYGPMVVLGRGAVFDGRGSPVTRTDCGGAEDFPASDSRRKKARGREQAYRDVRLNATAPVRHRASCPR